MIEASRIEAAIAELFENIRFAQSPEGLYDPLRYMIEIGGKRLRPRLCLTAYSLFKDEFDESVLEPAAGIEVFHSFTLIHDDIMDKSPLRRGKPVVWKKWNEDTAILSGDVMCIDSYRRVASAPASVLSEVMSLFNTTAAQVCEGQQYDMDFESRERVSMKDYIRMIGLKTGVLIACAAKMGALIGGASADDCEKLYRYGYDLGLAFQVADDYLDAYGDEKVFGKPIGGDILNKKQSWLTVKAYEKSASRVAATELGCDCSTEAITELLNSKAETAEEKAAKVAGMKAIYKALGVDKDAEFEVRRLTDSALSHAESLSVSAAGKTVLADFAYRLVRRNK